MTQTRDIPTAVLLTATTGRLLAHNGFGEFHAFAEWFYDRPIWTHEFVALAEPLRRDVLAQHPTLTGTGDGIDQENYKERLYELEAQFGKTLPVSQVTTQPMTADPISTLRDALGGAQ